MIARSLPATPEPDYAFRGSGLDPAACDRALASRDPRFDGVFFVGIRTTMIYCRPVCPARVSYPDRRRFFETAAAAERDGFRPCLRCRPELAPGRAPIDAVHRVAQAAAVRIAAGALNDRGVGDLARELGVGERQLRRAMERELGVSPIELAQTHRLLLAKCLLTDTNISITQVAFASGFQSLRRFNTAFREHYRMSPSALRRRRRTSARAGVPASPGGDMVRLSLAYRAPLAWEPLLQALAVDAQPGMEVIEGGRYGRTVELDGHRGVVFLEDAASAANGRSTRRSAPATHVNVDLSVSLLPVLMPLLARLRHLLDLDAEPAVIDAHLRDGGLAALVARRPGLRIPGAFDGFEVAIRQLVRSAPGAQREGGDLIWRITEALGEPIETEFPALIRLGPTAARVADAGTRFLGTLGVPEPESAAIVAIARAIVDGTLRLEPGADARSTLGALIEIAGVDEGLATAIVMRALHWPDAFPSTDASLQRAAGVTGSDALVRLAEQWRPWRAYAALHLSLHDAPLRSRSRVRPPTAVRSQGTRRAFGVS